PPAGAADDEIREVAGRAALVEPELAGPRAVVLRTVHEAVPVEVVDVASRARAHEARRDDLPPVEAAPVVEGLAVDEAARASTLRAGASLVLDDEPFGEAPGADPAHRLRRVVRVGRRRVEPGRRDAGHLLELADESRLGDLLQVARPGPCVEAADDGRVPWKIDERARAVGRDHLAPANLPVRLPGHRSGPTCPPLMSFRKRFTSGSTSRSERLVRNFRWCSESKSRSSISRSSGRRRATSQRWYCIGTPAARYSSSTARHESSRSTTRFCIVRSRSSRSSSSAKGC